MEGRLIEQKASTAPLLVRGHRDLQSMEAPLSFPLKTLALSMGTMGLTSAFLYMQPSINCAHDPYCAKPLSDMTTPLAATILLIACGSADFVAMNAYFGYEGVLQLGRMLDKLPSTTKKALVTAALLFVSAIENTIPIAVSKGAGAPDYVTALSFAGAYPGMFYSAINIFKNDFPYIKNQLTTAFKKFQLTQLRGSLTLEEQHTLTMIEKQVRFKKQCHADWLSMLSKIKTLELPEEGDLVKHMMSEHHVDSIDESPVIAYERMMMQAIGFYTAAHLLGTLYLQVYTYAKDALFKGSALDAGLFTGTIGLFLSYLFPKITVGGFSAMYDGIHNMFTGKPIDWLAYQLHPVRAITFGAVGFVTSAISHATLVATFNHVYQGPYKDMLRDGVYTSIYLYHLFGLMKLFNLWERKHPQNEMEKQLYQLVQQIEVIDAMSLDEFIAYSKPSESQRQVAERIEVVFPPSQSAPQLMMPSSKSVSLNRARGSQSELNSHAVIDILTLQDVELASSSSDSSEHEPMKEPTNSPVVTLEPEEPVAISLWQRGSRFFCAKPNADQVIMSPEPETSSRRYCVIS